MELDARSRTEAGAIWNGAHEPDYLRVLGGLIGVHWSLALSAMVLLAITILLFALTIPGQQRGEYS